MSTAVVSFSSRANTPNRLSTATNLIKVELLECNCSVSVRTFSRSRVLVFSCSLSAYQELGDFYYRASPAVASPPDEVIKRIQIQQCFSETEFQHTIASWY